MEHATQLLVWGIVAHLVADWLLQNEWMAVNKVKIRHPASVVHAVVHFIALGPVFWSYPFAWASLTIAHQIIDTRAPLIWWRRTFRQTTTGEMGLHVAVWSDQVTHIICIALAALLVR